MIKIPKIFMMFLSLIAIIFLLINPVAADNAGLKERDFQLITKPNLTEEEFKVQQNREKRLDDLVIIFERSLKNDGDLLKEYYPFLLKEFDKTSDLIIGINVFLPQKELIGTKMIYSNVLGVQTYGQETTYYCGPASAYQLLKFKGINYNPNNGKNLSQTNLASDLGTTTQGTSFVGNWILTLNSWTNRGVSWRVQWSPSENDVYNRTVNNVNAGWPLIYDCHMNSQRGYLIGYTSGEIYHYVTGDGYQWSDTDATFKQCHYVDPNRYKSAAYGPHYISASRLSSLMQGLGLIY
ncbi:Peptidase_C39 like family protein [Thermosyntropha lipolytica DSM 11003]|uniref:Peptidase_C39 like family protein n=1 Tax=Thermosyntropha lipolytica DSM 11003 TaxID=1123382 RepID=A0A1M5P751_9FIRM|nr:C39 family peptidase [Thermosyntropha lipolytica]SHG97063.1 Peptidase_C39 like family protein [Thermosyntropha lipolytica DSM 11003]